MYMLLVFLLIIIQSISEISAFLQKQPVVESVNFEMQQSCQVKETGNFVVYKSQQFQRPQLATFLATRRVSFKTLWGFLV